MSGTSQSSGSFIRRKINVVFSLGTGPDGNGTPTETTLTGLRVSAQVSNATLVSFGSADIRIYGMTQSMMNQISTLGLYADRVRNNRISLLAGDDATGMSLVYQGQIKDAWGDYTGMPETFFHVQSQDGLLHMLQPVPPSSFQGSVNIVTVLQKMATDMGYVFENNGVTAKLNNPYFAGTLMQQFRKCCQASRIDYAFEKGVAAIWPRGGSRNGTAVLLSPQTGLWGYPSFSSSAIALRTLYNPAIRYGGTIKLQSSVTPASGTWFVQQLSHDLEAEMPDGNWFSDIVAIRTPIDVSGPSAPTT